MIHLNGKRAACGLAILAGSFAMSRHKDVRPLIADLQSRIESSKNALCKKSIESFSIFILTVRRAAAGSALKVDELFYGHFSSCPPKHSIVLLFKNLRTDFARGKDLSSPIEALKTFIREEESSEIIEFALRQMNDFLNELRDPGWVDSVIHFILPMTKDHSRAYSETRKEELLKLCDLFPLVNDWLHKDIDEKLIVESKINFSNLPLQGTRENLSPLFMDERDQVTYLFKALQEKEDALVDEIVALLSYNFWFLLEKDIEILNKMLGSTEECDFSVPSKLTKENKDKLRFALEHQGAKTQGILQQMLDAALSAKEEYISESPIKLLKRTSKCKAFFQDQLNSPREDLRIPYWYHASREDRMIPLIKSAYIDVMFKGPEDGFKGAWVSSRAEIRLFGALALALSNAIEKMDANPSIRLTFEDRRWRGLPVPIPLKEKSVLVVASVRSNKDKTIQRAAKLQLNQLLIENHYPKRYKILSGKQLVFLQKEINAILGNPNLSSAFWGRQ